MSGVDVVFLVGRFLQGRVPKPTSDVSVLLLIDHPIQVQWATQGRWLLIEVDALKRRM